MSSGKLATIYIYIYIYIHKAGIEGGRTEREDMRMQTEVVWTREEYGHVKRMEENEFVRWSAERREPGTRRSARRRKRWMGCVRDDGRVVDLDKVDDKIEWRKVWRRPNAL